MACVIYYSYYSLIIIILVVIIAVVIIIVICVSQFEIYTVFCLCVSSVKYMRGRVGMMRLRARGGRGRVGASLY